MMSFKESIRVCLFEKFSTISGRATRAEYWWFQLLSCPVILGYVLISFFLMWDKSDLISDIALPWITVLILLNVPSFCARIRRLHDVGFSGWLILLCLIFGFLGGIVVFVMTLLKSDEDNKWGPNPHKVLSENMSSVEKKETEDEKITKTEVNL